MTAPPVVLTASLLILALLTHGVLAEPSRLDTALHGGRLLPVGSWSSVWHDYLAAWHANWGGTGSPAPASLFVLGMFGTILGGPSTVVAAVLLLAMPLAGLSAYGASRVLPATPSWRALVAGAYAVFPAATASAGQGRLDVVVAHVLVPPLLVGVAAVLGLVPVRQRWLTTACQTALGLALVGAFSPLAHVTLFGLLLIGFIALPSAATPTIGTATSSRAKTCTADLPEGSARRGRGRLAGTCVVVLLSFGCLLPWSVHLLRDPAVLLHGLGAQQHEASPGAWLLLLSPDGSMPTWLGGLFPLTALVAAVSVQPGRRLLAPGVVVGVGWLLAAVLGTIATSPAYGSSPTPGWTGVPLVLVAAGCCWLVLSAPRLAAGEAATERAGRQRLSRALRSVPVVVLVLLVASGSAAAATGPLRPARGVDDALAAELDGSGWLWTTGTDRSGPRLVDGIGARFGTDDLRPVDSTRHWLDRADARLATGLVEPVRAALAAATAHGVRHIATDVPEPLMQHAGDLVTRVGHLPDGRTVLRLRAANPVQLLGPDQSRRSRVAKEPSPLARPTGVRADPSTTPYMTLRVSDGGVGRQLVLGVANEPGWWARVDGRSVPLADAWGGQLAVPLPKHAARVEVGYTYGPRAGLLLGQAAVLLFTLVGALPEWRRGPRGTLAGSGADGLTSGSSDGDSASDDGGGQEPVPAAESEQEDNTDVVTARDGAG